LTTMLAKWLRSISRMLVLGLGSYCTSICT